jgi:hypothetical protein
MTVEEIYQGTIRPLPPSERFRLATLILNEIQPQSVLDIGDAWDEQDVEDATAYSARVFGREYEYPEEDTLAEAR